MPRSPQGRPVVFQAGDSEEGREFAAADADAIFSRHGTLEEGRAFYADVKGRLARYGHSRDELLILPAATFVLGATDAEARERAREVRRQQVSGQTALRFLEQVWNRDLSGYDPDGPLPEIDPKVGEHTVAQGRASVRMFRDPVATAKEWRERAAARQWSIREFVIETTGRQNFVGSPASVAEQINELVQADASDGFILVRGRPLVPGRHQRPDGESVLSGAARRTEQPMRRVGIAVVGVGPRATGLLDRIVANAPQLLPSAPDLTIHLIDPHPPGPGRVWRHDQSPLLRMNSMAEDVTMFTDAATVMDGPVRPGPLLAEWAAGPDVRTVADPAVRAELEQLAPTDFATRRVQSAYLDWVLRRTTAALAPTPRFASTARPPSTCAVGRTSRSRSSSRPGTLSPRTWSC